MLRAATRGNARFAAAERSRERFRAVRELALLRCVLSLPFPLSRARASDLGARN